VFFVCYAWFRHWQQKTLDLYAEAGVRSQWRILQPSFRWRLRRVWIWIGVMTLLVCGCMRPQWIPTSAMKMTSSAYSVLYVLDASLSMQAEDIKPSRLIQAKRMILEIARRLDAVPAGLIIFEQEARMVCPPTQDVWAFAQAVESVRVKSLAKHGTQLEDALRLVSKKMETARVPKIPMAVVVFSDGEMNRGGDPERIARVLATQQVPVFCIGIGTPEGAPIPLGRDFWGNPQYRMHRGQRVIARLNSERLEHIARITQGDYWEASHGSSAITSTLVRALQQHTWLNSANVLKPMHTRYDSSQAVELFPWFVLAACLGWGLERWLGARAERWLP
jgi:Ca-activated chloride channel family protein